MLFFGDTLNIKLHINLVTFFQHLVIKYLTFALSFMLKKKNGRKEGDNIYWVSTVHETLYIFYLDIPYFGEGNGIPLQYSCWKIPWMEEPGGLQSMGSLRVGHDWVTSLSLFTFHFHALEKEMATHSSVLAWRIPGTEEPGGLPLWGRTESATTEAT